MNLQVLSSKPQLLGHSLNELVANLDIYISSLNEVKMQTNASSSVSIFRNHETEFVFYREYRQIYFYLKKKITFIFREALMSYQTQILPIKSQIYKLACSI